MTDLAEIRARAAEHEEEIESLRWLRASQLADRWGISETTVREIPFDELPYREFGKGQKLKRRRYRPDDVAAYEAKTPTPAPRVAREPRARRMTRKVG